MRPLISGSHISSSRPSQFVSHDLICAFPLMEEGIFKAKGPEIYRVHPDRGSTGHEVTVKGKFFGSKKGKVYIGEKSCKVESWTMETATGMSEVKFLVPKGLLAGTYGLTISNKVGVHTKDGPFTID